MIDSDVDYQQQKDISKLWSAIIEIRTALVGIDGTNGLRGEFRDFVKKADTRDVEIRRWQKEVEERWNKYLSQERITTCIGSKRLESYIEEEKQKREERRKTDVTAVEYKKAVTVALITSMSSIVVAIASIIAGILTRG